MADVHRSNTDEPAQDNGDGRNNEHKEPVEEQFRTFPQGIPNGLSYLEIIEASDFLSSGQIPVNGLTRIPSQFPTAIAQITERIPFIREDDGIHNIQKMAIMFIGAVIPDSLDGMALLRQIAAFVDQAASSVSEDVTRLLTGLTMMIMYLNEGSEFTILDVFDVFAGEWANRLTNYMNTTPDTVFQDIFRIPISGSHLLKLFRHVKITTGDGISSVFDMAMTDCPCYKPPLTEEIIQSFMGSLPEVSVDGLEEDARECSICRESFEQVSVGEPEEAVRLPCGHVLGKSCLRAMVETWGRRSCPLCRRPISIFPKTPLSKFLCL